jgi:hypothetical protein
MYARFKKRTTNIQSHNAHIHRAITPDYEHPHTLKGLSAASPAHYNMFTHADNAPFRFIDVIEVLPFSAAASCIAPSAPTPFSARATAGVTRAKRANLRKKILCERDADQMNGTVDQMSGKRVVSKSYVW